MMEDDDGRSFHYNQLIFHQHQQQDMLTQPPFASSSFNPTIVYNPLLIPPPPSLYSYSDQHMNSDLTDGQSATLFGSSMVGNMLSHEFEKMRSIDMMEDKALAASRSHSEAERRRRERINCHLTQLRSLLPNTTKTDKASLLAEVLQRVKDLKQQTSSLSEFKTVPTEFDELTFETCNTQDDQLVIKVSLCCEDRSDILQDLIKTFQALNLRAMKSDITTISGRLKYVAFILGDSSDLKTGQPFIRLVQEAFREIIGRSLRKDDDMGMSTPMDGSLKRRRVKGKSERLAAVVQGSMQIN
ncbi:unnamed protein product [Rhodiola kirilowii]